MSNRQEQDATEVGPGLGEPRPGVLLSLRQGRSERGCVSIHDVPVSAHLGQDQQDTDSPRHPAKVARHQLRQQPVLLVHGRQKGLDVPQPRLDLDDQERAGRGMPGQNVDRASLAEMIE
jgi:hypothetical protein